MSSDPSEGFAAALAPRDRRLLELGGFAISLVLFITVYRPWNLADAFMIGAPFGRDFANFWSGGHLALAGRLDLLVDLPGYNDFIAATFHHSHDQLVFSYPPHILLFLVPFGALPFVPSLVVWTGLNLILIDRSVRLLAGNDHTEWGIAACLSPAAITMVAYGHFGGALAFLAVYVLTRGDGHPRMAGVCLALMSVKPQLAVSLGILLLLIGRWRAVLWSVPATACLVGLSLVVFGLKPWIDFVEWTVPFHASVISSYTREALKTTASVYAAARLADLSAWAGYALQYAFSSVVLVGAAVLVVRRGMTPRNVALALLAVLTALPYFQNYDFAIVIPALTVALFEDRPSAERPFLSIVPASLLWIAPAFSLSFGLLALPAVPVVVAAVVLLAMSGELWPHRSGVTGSPAIERR
jgi:alpha-1,2-mannosyltransferase